MLSKKGLWFAKLIFSHKPQFQECYKSVSQTGGNVQLGAKKLTFCNGAVRKTMGDK